MHRKMCNEKKSDFAADSEKNCQTRNQQWIQQSCINVKLSIRALNKTQNCSNRVLYLFYSLFIANLIRENPDMNLEMFRFHGPDYIYSWSSQYRCLAFSLASWKCFLPKLGPVLWNWKNFTTFTQAAGVQQTVV